jgi:hypothetical protein
MNQERDSGITAGMHKRVRPVSRKKVLKNLQNYRKFIKLRGSVILLFLFLLFS